MQYVGVTSQTLRNWVNNHRSRLSKLCELYLYLIRRAYIDDLSMEEVTTEEGGCTNKASKRLQREDYWYRELNTVSPYGLNDNIRGVGNISKNRDGIVVCMESI